MEFLRELRQISTRRNEHQAPRFDDLATFLDVEAGRLPHTHEDAP